MKKTYMDRKNILSEGFFKKIFKKLNIKPNMEKAIRKNKKIRFSLFGLNKATRDLEKALKNQYDIDIKLDRFKLSDFMDK